MRRAVLLDGLHGAAWRLFPLRRSLLRQGIDEVEIFSYRSHGGVPIEELADELAAFLQPRSEGAELAVVAHSMGGLITRAALARHPGVSVQRAVLICVPHRGSHLAACLPSFIPWVGVRQMIPGSDFLRWLDGQPWEIPTLGVWCPGDLMVLPGHHARWERAEMEEVCRVPLHNWPLLSPAFHGKIGDFLLGRSPSTSPHPSLIPHTP